MTYVNIIRAWKDESYRKQLSDTERTMLPVNPAGFVELPEKEMNHVNGGDSPCSQYGDVCYVN